MKRIYLVLFLTFFVISSYAQETTKSTYYLIRHAEKDRTDKKNKNPHLTKEGKQRANKWMKVFSSLGIDEIYSTDYNRTRGTIKKLANTNGIGIKTYHPFKIDMEAFRKETIGKIVVIVGHSNTTAAFANKLIGSEVYPEIKDDNNANLYIVTLDGENVSHVLIKMK